jgi:four helix bundle protein
MDAKMEEGRRTKEDVPKRPPIRSFRDLEVYQRGQAVMARVHKLVLTFPSHEKRGLTDQMMRASKSVGGLIAEGWALRASEKHFKHYLRRTMGSANEMEAHLDTAKVLDYISEESAEELIGEYQIIARQLHQLIQNWRTYPTPSSSVLLPSSRRNGTGAGK